MTDSGAGSSNCVIMASFDQFMANLEQAIQDQTSTSVEKVLKRNDNGSKHEIPVQIITLATAKTTLMNKIKTDKDGVSTIRESPIKTLQVLCSYGLDLATNNARIVRDLLYDFFTIDGKEQQQKLMFEMTFDCLDFILCRLDSLPKGWTAQYFDCRIMDPEDSYFLVSCPQDIDKSMSRSFKALNATRKEKLNQLKQYMSMLADENKTVINAQDVLFVIADYTLGGDYVFIYNIDDYNSKTGEYLQQETTSDSQNDQS